MFRQEIEERKNPNCFHLPLMIRIVRRTQERTTKMRRSRREGRRVAPSVRATGKTLSCKSIVVNMQMAKKKYAGGRQEGVKVTGLALSC